MKKGWEIKKLGEVCDFFDDGNWIEKKDQSEEGIRLIQTGNIGNGVFKNRKDKARYISEDTFNKLKCTEIFKNDCLVSRLPDPVGRACIIPNINERMITAVDCTIIRFKPKTINSKYFVYYSLSQDYLKSIYSKVTGATRQRISRKNLATIQIPIPPLPEQKRIVSILDRAFEAIDKAKANAEQNLKNAKELFESYSRTLYERLISENKKGLLGDLAKLVRGPFGGSLKKSMFVEKGYTVYEQRNAIGDFTDDFRYFIDEKKFNEMGRFSVKEGDMLMSCSGTIGKFTIIKDNYIKGIINQALLKISPDTSKIDNKFLLFVLSNFIQDGSSHSKGAAIKNIIAVKELKKIEIPLLTIETQKQIVSQLDKLQAETKKLEAIYQKKIDNFEELKKSVLQKAFKGEL